MTSLLIPDYFPSIGNHEIQLIQEHAPDLKILGKQKKKTDRNDNPEKHRKRPKKPKKTEQKKDGQKKSIRKKERFFYFRSCKKKNKK